MHNGESGITSIGRRAFLLSGLGAVPALGIDEWENPAGPHSRFPSLSSRDGRLLLSWLEDRGNGDRRFRYSIRRHGRWQEPQIIASGPQLFINWADFPSALLLEEDRLAAHWLERNANNGGYGIRIAFGGSGRAWSKSFVSVRPGESGYEGFVSFAQIGHEVLASFLDHSQPVTSLRLARFQADGRFVGERVLDPDVCSCCQTNIVNANGVPVVAYRGHDRHEIRDIGVVRGLGQNWSPPAIPVRDRWKINACPVNGPALAAVNDQVGMAWYSAGLGPRVQVAFSRDHGASFGSLIRLDGGNPIGRVAITAAPAMDQTAFFISWLERTPLGAELRLSRVSAEGGKVRRFSVAQTASARLSGFPRILAQPKGICVAWTSDSGVRTVLVPFDSLEA